MQPSLLGPDAPDGFEYCPGFLAVTDEQQLLRHVARIQFAAVQMRGAVARRRTAHYGWTYGYEARTSEPGTPIPPFLLPLRERAAAWLEVAPEALSEALVTEYPPGAPIGWHRDAPMFGEIVGISLRTACRMKFRPYVSPRDVRSPRRTTHSVELAPRSAYLITGIARKDFEHSIPPVEGMRYSITFRTIRKEAMRKGKASGL